MGIPISKMSTMNGAQRRATRRFILRKYRMRCMWCNRICDERGGSESDAFPTLEHILPRALGGCNRRHNLGLACRKCNNDRGARI